MIATDLVCPECSGRLEYRARGQFGRPWYACEHWPQCRGAHGAHPDGTPLGKPANAETRAARVRAHDAFDALWKPGGERKRGARRRRAYARLDTFLRVPPGAHAHIGNMTLAECEQVIAWANGQARDPKRAPR